MGELTLQGMGRRLRCAVFGHRQPVKPEVLVPVGPDVTLKVERCVRCSVILHVTVEREVFEEAP